MSLDFGVNLGNLDFRGARVNEDRLMSIMCLFKPISPAKVFLLGRQAQKSNSVVPVISKAKVITTRT